MKLKKSQKRVLVRIIVAAALLLLCHILIGGHSHFGENHGHVHLPDWAAALCYLVPYFIIGYDILWKAVRGIFHGQLFDENFLMAVATVGVLSIGLFPDQEPEYLEAVMVMLLYQTGELFQSIAVGKSRNAIASLMEICPDTANVERDGKVEEVFPDEVAVGDIIVVKPGEKVPLDGTVIEGASSLNTVALTGESNPRGVSVGDGVISGCINMNGVLRVRVEKEFGESTVSKILELVETSGDKKSKSEAYITRFARWYTPIVVCSAAALAILPPVITGLIGGFESAPWSEWILRAINFLIISCPCALVISVPMSFFGGIGGASRHGILIKGSNYLEALAKAETVVFDKTGTLTKGNFKVTAIHPEKIDEQALLDLAATAESYSDHPISRSLKQAYAKEVDNSRVGEVREIAASLGFTSAGKKDSQDICFIPDGNYAAFIEQYTDCRFPTGDFVDRNGVPLGKHKGIIHYTVGQRKGLGIALGEPMYVSEKNVEKNTVTLVRNEELFEKSLDVCRVNLMLWDRLDAPVRVKAKVRYHHTPAWATVTQTDTDRLHVEFDEPVRAIAPGQSFVMYVDDYLAGGGIIT